MFRYSQQTNAFIRADNDKNVGLHDCKATHISWNDGEFSFYFLDGFWVEQQVGACRKSFYTGEARVEFPLLYHDETDVTIYIFTKENDKTIRDECVLEDFIKLINEKKYQLVFLYAYIGYMELKYDCWLWFDEEPYHKECELIISTEKAIYRWNDMYEEK